MALYKLTAKLSHWCFCFLKNLTKFLDAAYSGFWLGTMSQKSLDFSDELYYRSTSQYMDDKYNEQGLFEWEKPVVEKHFPGTKSILLIAAGGGREALALSKMGFDVDSYECNPALVEYGNGLLKRNNINIKIRYLPRNSVPVEIKKYDAIIIGWGAYSHIPGVRRRLAFLDGLHPFFHNETRLMISILWVKNKNRRDSIIKSLSNFFRTFSGKDKTEPGDRLEPDFIHYFTVEEIKNEINQSKFRLIDFYDTEYGCLIATI